MPSALLLAIGSRGDTEPLIALFPHLQKHFSTVHLLHQPEYTDLLPSNPSLVSHPLPFTAESFTPFFIHGLLRHAFQSLVTLTPFDTVRMQVECICSINAKIIIPFFESLHGIVKETKPSVILTTTLGFNLAASVAELMNIPCCLINFQPNTPTTDYPHYMTSTDIAVLAGKKVADMHEAKKTEDKGNRATYDAMLGMFAMEPLNVLRERHGLKPWTRDDLRELASGRTGSVINSYPSALVPPSTDQAPNVHIVPPLAADYLPLGWDPQLACPEISAFLAHAQKPVVITFGSMGHNLWNSHHTRVLFTALRNAQVNDIIILNSGCDLGTHQLWRYWDRNLITWAGSSQIRVLSTKEKPPYAWLLPHTRAVICHGGAGTTFAALRAGVPVVILPVLCDQFFWGTLVERLGLGAMPGALSGVGSPELEKAIEKVLKEEVQQRTTRFGDEMRAEDNDLATAAKVVKTVSEQACDT